MVLHSFPGTEAGQPEALAVDAGLLADADRTSSHNAESFCDNIDMKNALPRNIPTYLGRHTAHAVNRGLKMCGVISEVSRKGCIQSRKGQLDSGWPGSA